MRAGGSHARPEERLQQHLTRLVEPAEALAGRIPLRSCLPLTERVWAVEAGVPYAALAKALSSVEGGQWCAGQQGLTWVCGRRCCWLVEARAVPAVLQARAVAKGLGWEGQSYTLGGVARGLLQWTGVQQRHYRCSQQALGGLCWAYRQVEPGRIRAARLQDLNHAYHQVLARMPSPKLDWLPDGPCWEPLVGEEAERWARLVQATAAEKSLRTRIVGCMLGGGPGGLIYCRGQRLQSRTRRGPLRTGALLIARTVYELCALEARDCGAVYANTDAVITTAGERRRVWERYGYSYRTEAEGEADVIAAGVYRVGERQTRWYGAGGRYEVPCPPLPLPQALTLDAWH